MSGHKFRGKMGSFDTNELEKSIRMKGEDILQMDKRPQQPVDFTLLYALRKPCY